MPLFVCEWPEVIDFIKLKQCDSWGTSYFVGMKGKKHKGPLH